MDKTLDLQLISALISTLVAALGLTLAARWGRDALTKLGQSKETVLAELIHQRIEPYTQFMKQIEGLSSRRETDPVIDNSRALEMSDILQSAIYGKIGLLSSHETRQIILHAQTGCGEYAKGNLDAGELTLLFQAIHHALRSDLQFPLEQEPPLFVWEDVRFAHTTPLYSDWNHLERTSGGINNVGFGFPMASVSAGWRENLMSKFQKTVQGDSVDLDLLHLNQEAIVTGFVSFFGMKLKLHGESHLETIEMEGTHWVAAAFSTGRRLESMEDLKTIPWVLTYFRQDAFMFPMDLWEKIAQPISVYSEVVPADMTNDVGRISCFLKARTAAVIV